MSQAAPVVVVGGGLAGLTAAHALALAGVPVRLYEASARTGGVVRTEHEAGFLLEAGPDAILGQKPAGLALVKALGLEDRLVPTNVRERTVYMWQKGRLLPLPEGMTLGVPRLLLPFARSRIFSLAGKLRMASEILRSPRLDAEDESIESFVGRRLGKEAVRLVGDPLLAGIHAGDPARLSMLATFPRLRALEASHGSLIRGLRQGPPVDPATPAFYSLVNGMQELTDALLAHLPEGIVETGAAVASIDRDSAGLAVQLRDGRRVKASAVVVALPPRAASAALGRLAADAAEILGALRAESTATVLLGYRREQVAHALSGYGALVPRNEGLRITAATFVSSKLPGRAPAGHVLLRGFLGGARDPHVLDLADHELAAIVRRDLETLVGVAGEPVLARVFRWPFGTPQMDVGHIGRMERLAARVAAVPGLFVTGAGLRGTGIPDTIADAQSAAASAAAYVQEIGAS